MKKGEDMFPATHSACPNYTGLEVRGLKVRALATASVLAVATSMMLTTGAAHAADAQAAQADVDEIVVTGTRIIRDGYQAPTPLTVITAEALAAGTATANLADTLNTMPVFANSTSPQGAASGVSAATQGLNVLNLR